MIHRHNKSAIFMHWFNALCWIPLLATGFAILSNPQMQPAGSWWTDVCISVLGEKGLLAFHLGLGLLWVTVYAVCILLNARSDVIPFLREILQVRPVSDAVWCIRKGYWLILGEKGMKRFGLSSELPPQGFYNAGQKWVAIAAVLFSVGLAVTGIALGLCPGRLVSGSGFLDGPSAADRSPVPPGLRRDHVHTSGRPHLHGRVGPGGRPGPAFHVHGICAGRIRKAPQSSLA